eukprot:3916325-Rhodomonas_salina.1
MMTIELRRRERKNGGELAWKKHDADHQDEHPSDVMTIATREIVESERRSHRVRMKLMMEVPAMPVSILGIVQHMQKQNRREQRISDSIMENASGT